MVGVDWSKQGLVFVLAAVLSLYWTSKQGLWDALTGSWDKEWRDAHQLLSRKLTGRGFVVIDGTSIVGGRRMLVLTDRPTEVAPVVAGELTPILNLNPRMRNMRDHQRKGRFGPHGRRKSREPPKEPVARLRIYSPELEFLRDIFKHDERREPPPGHHLIEIIPDPKSQAEDPAASKAKPGHGAEQNQGQHAARGNAHPKGAPAARGAARAPVADAARQSTAAAEHEQEKAPQGRAEPAARGQASPRGRQEQRQQPTHEAPQQPTHEEL